MQSATPQDRIPITLLLFITMLLISSLAHITADLYTPSMPAIAKALATSARAVQFTLAIFMLGFSLSNLFYGPISDRLGRRFPLLLGIGMNVIGSLVCLAAPSISILIIGRFLQGAGVGACNSVGRSLTRDLLSGNHLAQLGSHMGMIIAFVTAASPTLGGYLQHYFNWRMNFLFLLLYAFSIWLMTWKYLPETNLHLNPDATKFRVILSNYGFLLKNKTFVGYTLCASVAYAGIIAYLTAAPFLFQTVIGLTPIQFGWLAFFIATSIFISAFLNSRWVLTKGISHMIFIGNYLMISGGLIMLMCGLLGWINPFVIIIPIALYALGGGFTFSNAFAGAFHPFPQMAGATGALYGCIQVLGASLASAIMAFFHEENQIPLAIMLTLLGFLALSSLKYLALRE